MTDPLTQLNKIEELLMERIPSDIDELRQLLSTLPRLLTDSEFCLYNVLHSLINALPLSGPQHWLLKTLALSVISELQLLIVIRSPSAV